MLNEYKDNSNIYLKKHNLLFINIPKVASSTIWSICAQLEYGFQTKNKKDIRSIQLPAIKTSELSNYPGVKKIAFVRNPFDRLVSTYRNKIEKKEQKFLKENQLNAALSFSDFITHVCSLKDCDSDRHFRSQYTFIYNNEGQPIIDYLGHFESFVADMETIIQQFQLPISSVAHWNKELTRDYTQYYTAAQIEQIRKRYLLDLTLFKYEFNTSPDAASKTYWSKPLSIENRLAIVKYKNQKLLRVIRVKEEFNTIPKGIKGVKIRLKRHVCKMSLLNVK